MPSISISRSHALTHRNAKDAAERLAKDLAQRFGLAWNWKGEHIHFERPGVSGSMHVGATTIRLEAKLGMLLGALKPAIEREIHAQLDTLTGPRSTG